MVRNGTGEGTMIRALLVAALLTACSPTQSAEPQGKTLTGTFSVAASEGAGFSGACHGGGGYDDIAGGMGVTLKDGDGTVIGSTQLGTGQASADRDWCVLPFSFSDVPDADFYVIDMGRRGEQTYSRADLEAQDWTVGLEIGG